MQRVLFCVLGACCAANSHADLIRTDAHASWQNEHILISSRLTTSPTPKFHSASPPQRLLHTPQTLSAATLFDTNSAQLKGTASLTPIMQSLEAIPATRVTVTGHTDNTGSQRYNQTLSLQRAFSVIDVLRKSAPQHSYIAQGQGEMRPMVSNQTAGGRAQNRRVVVEVQHDGK